MAMQRHSYPERNYEHLVAIPDKVTTGDSVGEVRGGMAEFKLTGAELDDDGVATGKTHSVSVFLFDSQAVELRDYLVALTAINEGAGS